MLFLGVHVERETEEACSVVIPRIWRTRNPFGVTYFAALIAAGEMAGGMLLIQRILDLKEEGYRPVVLITKTDSIFKRTASGPITFTCIQGDMLDDFFLLPELEDGKFHEVNLESTGINENGKIAAVVNITWSVKLIA